MPVPTLPEALRRLYERIPLGMRLGLDPMRDACARTGHPEQAFPVVHVAGTNGKGSVSAMVEAIARAAHGGMRTGLYTSPHLCRFAERIRIDGEPVTDEALATLLGRALDDGPDLSFFETATLAAFLAFRDARVDLAIVEVGLGGRLDATNVVPLPRAAAITRIALDHTDRLGTTLVEIAREKAGIAKQGLDIVLGPMPADVRAAIDEVAHAAGATTTMLDARAPLPARIGLAGAHQQDNARIAAELGRRIGAPPRAIEDGIAGVRWPGRLERIGNVLLDAAHNPDGAEALAAHVRSLGLPPEAVTLVFGTLADKDWAPMLDTLAPLAAHRVYVAPSGASRSVVQPSAMVARHAGAISASLPEALDASRQARLTLVAGSLVLVGQARALLLGLPRDPPVAL
ncbi:MAG TPA: folylpolyglutamate synthase/dihydrofolate synthase family protein [Polyangiaceae bacterium]